MRVIKDYVNGFASTDNNYTTDELLVLMTLYKKGLDYLYNTFNYDDAIMSHYEIKKIFDLIQPTDNRKTFDTLVNIAESLGVKVTPRYKKYIQFAKRQLKQLCGDALNISLHSYITVGESNILPVFNVNGKYICQFVELNYCPIQKDLYSYSCGRKCFANGHYAIYNIISGKFERHNIVFDTPKGIGFFHAVAYDGDDAPIEHFKIYKFNSIDDIQHASKLFENKTSLFKNIYHKHIVNREDT